MIDYEEVELTIDRLAYQERGTEHEIEKATIMLKKYSGNRIAISAMELTTESLPSAKGELSTLSFLILAHPHPKCAFEYVRISVDLSAFPEAKVTDYIPKSKQRDEPVKYTISNEKGLKFEATSIKLGPSYERRVSEEHTVYFDEISTGGLSTKSLNWDFLSPAPNKLLLQNVLKVKFTHSPVLVKLRPTISVEAHLKIDGWIGHIPLIGSKTIMV